MHIQGNERAGREVSCSVLEEREREKERMAVCTGLFAKHRALLNGRCCRSVPQALCLNFRSGKSRCHHRREEGQGHESSEIVGHAQGCADDVKADVKKAREIHRVVIRKGGRGKCGGGFVPKGRLRAGVDGQ